MISCLEIPRVQIENALQTPCKCPQLEEARVDHGNGIIRLKQVLRFMPARAVAGVNYASTHVRQDWVIRCRDIEEVQILNSCRSRLLRDSANRGLAPQIAS